MDEQKITIKSHWDRLPMNYIDTGDVEEGSDLSLNYFKKIDKIFKRKAFFAQEGDEKLFSGIINYSDLVGKKVLVVGCGMGSITQQLVLCGALVTAIDLSETSILATRKRLNYLGHNAPPLVDGVQARRGDYGL